MPISELIERRAARAPDSEALVDGERRLSYRELDGAVDAAARGFVGLGVAPGDRLAIYLPKCVEAVQAMFGAAKAGAVFVPINPGLKARQVGHILHDAGATVLVTSADRLAALENQDLADLSQIVLVGEVAEKDQRAILWQVFLEQGEATSVAVEEGDLAALLYTSGSTGKPKGVMVSHANLSLGATSVAQYLNNNAADRILCVLPLSFDYGLSQLTTAFHSGACAVLLNYLFPQDVMAALQRERITGLACVPPLWLQLIQGSWPAEAVRSLRYVTSSGGRMPGDAVSALRGLLPTTDIYLMYGLTEAFRSTYLDPSELDRRPDSIGKAIPYASVDVFDAAGAVCGPGEEGELVHAGPLVSLGYWRDPDATAARFRPAPPTMEEGGLAVWTGDRAYRDEDGFFYFVDRLDALIKSSGYRISPTEIEEVLYAFPGIVEAAVIGATHKALGQAIVALVVSNDDDIDTDAVLGHCRAELPAFMIPKAIILRDTLPRNANGKIDRPSLLNEMTGLFRSE